MRTWRAPMSATSQGAFVVIPETSHSDISYITREVCDQPLPKAIYEKSSKSYIWILKYYILDKKYCK